MYGISADTLRLWIKRFHLPITSGSFHKFCRKEGALIHHYKKQFTQQPSFFIRKLEISPDSYRDWIFSLMILDWKDGKM